MTKINGIDVSRWQGVIDFTKVKNDGIKFVIIKAGGSDCGFYTDSKFETNYNNAKKAGLLVGCYYFVGKDFNTTEKGILHAKHFEEIIKGKTFDYPIFLDLESTSTSEKIGVTNASISFMDYLIDKGYYVGIYSSSRSGFVDRLDTSKLTKYDKWVAQYSSNEPVFPKPYRIWQHSSQGRVNGISTNVDLDICYCDYPSIIKKSKDNVNNNKTNISKNKNTTNNTLNKLHNKKKIIYKNLAEDVVKGKYGNGEKRKAKILNKGYDYSFVQDIVNDIVNKKNINKVFNFYQAKYNNIAKQILKGKYGNGEKRKRQLKLKGYDYKYVQDIVNIMIGD